MDKDNNPKIFNPYYIISKMLNNLSGSAIGNLKPTSHQFHSSMDGRRKDAAHRRNIAKRSRQRAHLKSLRKS